MSERGFIAVDRGIFDHPLFDEKHEFSRREAWLWLLSEAEWKPREKYIGSRKIQVERGQLAHSIRFIADVWGWHKSKVERFIGRLKTETMIETASETGLLVITICNYGKYQSPPVGKRDSKRGAAETAARQQRDKPKEINNPTNTSSNEEVVVVARDPVKTVIEAYCRMASQACLPLIAAISDKRKAGIKARVEEHGLDRVLQAIERIGESDFCRGMNSNGWKADFDFLLQPSSFIKILEGKYDKRVGVQPEKPPDLADLAHERARQLREQDDGRTIEGSYERGDTDRSRQALPRVAASASEPGRAVGIVRDRLPQGDEARDRDGGSQVDPGRAGKALEIIRSVASGTGFGDP